MCSYLILSDFLKDALIQMNENCQYVSDSSKFLPLFFIFCSYFSRYSLEWIDGIYTKKWDNLETMLKSQ